MVVLEKQSVGQKQSVGMRVTGLHETISRVAPVLRQSSVEACFPPAGWQLIPIYNIIYLPGRADQDHDK